MNRRLFLRRTALASALAGVSASTFGCRSTVSTEDADEKELYSISVAEWSFHRTIRDQKAMTNLDFPKVARREFNIDGVEFVNQFFMDKANDDNYLTELKRICDGEGVKSLLIMCDGEGNLGDPDESKRRTAVSNHHKWADAAQFLGCHSIRVNAATGNVGSPAEQQKRAADGLAELSTYCKKQKLNCIVENHGGLSSNGKWLAGVMDLVDMPNCGTLPDFGNFRIGDGEMYDRYQGVEELMPYAKAVSAKSMEFDEEGNEITTDYLRMMQIVLQHDYHGFVGIEYEGGKHSEHEGVRLTKELLVRVRDQLS